MKLGADEFVVTSEKGFAKPLFDKLDYILSAADAAVLPLSDLLSTLKIDGKMTSVGLPDKSWKLHPQVMTANACSIGASHIGSKKEMWVVFLFQLDRFCCDLVGPDED